MKRTILPLLLVVLLTTGHSLLAQASLPNNVLFVGNSYTYFWNLPQTVMQMASERGISLTVRQSTSGGVNLGQHWRGERSLSSRDLIRRGAFDAVILQDHSMQAIDAPDSLLYFGELFGDMIKSKGAQPYVYMTWAREWDPYMQQEITDKYKALAKKINARIVPVGLAWQRARQLRPDIPLFDDDGSHPSSLGTYLTACVFFGVLTGQTPIGLPNRVVTTDKDGEKLYLSIQSLENAIFCQKVAAEIISIAENE